MDAEEIEGAGTVRLSEEDLELPDLLSILQDRIHLTRRSLYRILTGSGRLGGFRRNPQVFIDTAAQAINRCKQLAVIEGIKYQRLGDDHYYAQSLLAEQELTGYVKKLVEARKSVHEQVVWDSNIEKEFAEALERDQAIKFYTKLPGWFTVPTPLGNYNPDWAILVEEDGEERIYFVVETKGSLYADDLRHKEGAKIACGRGHFRALETMENSARYQVARTLDDLLRAL